VVEELAESARCSRSPRLLPVDIVHGLVHEQTKSEAKVEPTRTLKILGHGQQGPGIKRRDQTTGSRDGIKRRDSSDVQDPRDRA
jgi:hypothetical protein